MKQLKQFFERNDIDIIRLHFHLSPDRM